MPLLKLTDSELREVSRKHIESLEFWLRRVIDNALTTAYGNEYWNYSNDKGAFLLKEEIRNKISERINKEPNRYPRWIDATLIDHQVFIICKEDLYQSYFKNYFEIDFRFGKAHLKSILDTIVTIRNKVSHANPISVRDAEKAICYSNDIIDSIKNYYSNHNMNQDFNAPLILSYSDSLGNKIYSEEWKEKTLNVVNLIERGHKFRPGEKIRMSVEIDSSFSTDEYQVQWYTNMSIRGTGTTIEIEFTNKDVAQTLIIEAKVISNKPWHRHSSYDDNINIFLCILPPL